MLEKFAAVQMIDVHVPTTDGRELVLTRYTQPERELNLLLDKLKLELPAQSSPKISLATRPTSPLPCSQGSPPDNPSVNLFAARQSAKLASARPGKVDTGFPKRTCATHEIQERIPVLFDLDAL